VERDVYLHANHVCQNILVTMAAAELMEETEKNNKCFLKMGN